tara:strand:+ start:3066 stop:3311 length:246 start_codon:yes stop_codon:yes gene_type:complete
MPDPRSPEERLKRRKKAAKAALAEAQGYPTDSLTEEEKGYLKAMQKPLDKMPAKVDPKIAEHKRVMKGLLLKVPWPEGDDS